MAEQKHFEGFDSAPEEESRSAHKREAQAIRKLVEKIADLGDQSFKSLVIPQDVKDALIIARKLKPKSDERRRQLQYPPGSFLFHGFSRQEYWSGLPFSAPGDLPDPRIKLVSPAWQEDSLLLSHQGGPLGISRAASRQEQESEDQEEESVVTMFF